MVLGGTHHVSTLSAHIARSNEFYTRILGLRLLIKTVNQDAPGMYHLFFGDGIGSPGSDITVFDLPHAAREHHGNNAITLTTFRVAGGSSLRYWEDRLSELGVRHNGVKERYGRQTLDFEDFEGTQLSLVDDGAAGDAYPWPESTVPAEHQIRGLGYVVVTVPTALGTHEFLTAALGMSHTATYPTPGAPEFTTHVYQMNGTDVANELHVTVRDDLPRTRYGAGGVHHVALRAPDAYEFTEWTERLLANGHVNSGIVDRHYFRSIYVREPNGVLFELATDGPGFDVDQPLDGSRLSLPPLLEPRRSEIEAKLMPIETR